MNFVPFEFLDDVAATLPDLPFFSVFESTTGSYNVWEEAIENERSRRQTFALHFAFGNEEIRYSFRDGQLSLTFEDVKNLEKVQVQAICVRSYVPRGTSVDRSAFETIIDYIRPLMNCPKLELEVDAFDAIDFLNDIEFYEITAGYSYSVGCSVPNSFLSKQFKTGCLQKCFARPAGIWTKKFKENVEEFLTTQSFREVRLWNYVSKKLFGRLFRLTCDYPKKIYFYAHFNVFEESEKLRQGGNRAGVRVELLGKRTLLYVMTISSDRAVKL